MVAKRKTIFECQSCGSHAHKWLGKCPDCGEWNSFIEQVELDSTSTGDIPTDTRRFIPTDGANRPIPLSQVKTTDRNHQPIGMLELDRVLGGGLVPGSLVLLGGDPGIGKSTIILQMLARLSAKCKKSLYVTGEESSAQISLRAQRLKLDINDSLQILTENSIDAVLSYIRQIKPDICVIDSIQTVYSSQLQTAPGTVGQLREVAAQLLYTTKSTAMTTLLIGHVTKDGALAGPKVLEHMVDTVLYFEGERGHQYRLLRAVKNRFGSTNEVGVFEMTGEGLQEVLNPSAVFLSERPQAAAGSVVLVPVEGTRPILVELQALVSSSGFANPRRTVVGVDSNRVSLLAAVMDKVVGLSFGDHDIYVNVAGGLKVNEPASDLGIVLALASSFRNKPLIDQTIVIGEVGLTGEIRGVPQLATRLSEASKLGFKKAIIPKAPKDLKVPKGMECYSFTNVAAALEFAFA